MMRTVWSRKRHMPVNRYSSALHTLCVRSGPGYSCELERWMATIPHGKALVQPSLRLWVLLDEIKESADLLRVGHSLDTLHGRLEAHLILHHLVLHDSSEKCRLERQREAAWPENLEGAQKRPHRTLTLAQMSKSLFCGPRKTASNSGGGSAEPVATSTAEKARRKMQRSIGAQASRDSYFRACRLQSDQGAPSLPATKTTDWKAVRALSLLRFSPRISTCLVENGHEGRACVVLDLARDNVAVHWRTCVAVVRTSP
jgi:hypothetical protein